MFGMFGALRCQEIANIRTTDIEDTNNHLYVVTIHDTKTYYPRNFVIGAEYYNVVKKYSSLRPPDTPTDRFFLQYHNGKCSRQVIGKHKIGEVPKTIANYLNLENPDNYTGHCFRRSSATALSNSGANLNMVKQLGGWQSDAVAQGYLGFSIENRKEIFTRIAGTSNDQNVPLTVNVVQPQLDNRSDDTENINPHVIESVQEQESTSHENVLPLDNKRQPLHEVTRNQPQSKKRKLPEIKDGNGTSEESSLSSVTFQHCHNLVVHEIIINNNYLPRNKDAPGE